MLLSATGAGVLQVSLEMGCLTEGAMGSDWEKGPAAMVVTGMSAESAGIGQEFNSDLYEPASVCILLYPQLEGRLAAIHAMPAQQAIMPQSNSSTAGVFVGASCGAAPALNTTPESCIGEGII